MPLLKRGFARFLDFAALVGTAVMASFLWTALAVLILPLPAATAALFYTVGRALRGEAGNPIQDFLAGLRGYYRVATLVGLPGLLLGIALAVDALFLIQQPLAASQAAGWLFASLFLVWLATWLMFWPVLVGREEGWRRALRLSFTVAMARLHWSAAAVLATCLLAAMSLLVPWLIPFVAGLSALAASAAAFRSLRRYQLI